MQIKHIIIQIQLLYFHIERATYALSLQMIDKISSKGATIIDFGAGDGTFLLESAKIRPDLKLAAYEPYMNMRSEKIERFTSMESIPDKSVDIVVSFETLEHVSDADLESFIMNCRRILRVNGKMLISVPIMQGAALPVKQIVAAILHQRAPEYSFRELLAGTFGFDVSRPQNRAPTHKGFDHRLLKAQRRQNLSQFRNYDIALSRPFLGG